jgi:general secretion pathway protein K
VTLKHGEEGYAMVAAVAAMAMLATLAVTLVEGNKSGIAVTAAELGQARASAAADAGLALALDRLLAGEWDADGKARTARFAGASLRIRIEDERAKVPLNLLGEEAAERLAQVAGLSGEEARIMAASLLDWTDKDDDPRPFGAEADHYAASGIMPANGPLQSIDELALLRGFDPALIGRMRPYVSVDYGVGGFNARTARPEAVTVMLGKGGEAPIGETHDLSGHPLTIEVEARISDSARALRRTIVEMPRAGGKPYVIRAAR